jgi:hypothetical protein
MPLSDKLLMQPGRADNGPKCDSGGVKLKICDLK